MCASLLLRATPQDSAILKHEGAIPNDSLKDVRHIKSDVMTGAAPQLSIKVNLTLLALNESKLYRYSFLGTGQSNGSNVKFFTCPVGDCSIQGENMSKMPF